MVTTIKITCDGVFIQSNPYLTSPDAQDPGRRLGPNITNATPPSSDSSANFKHNLYNKLSSSGVVVDVADADEKSVSNKIFRSSSCLTHKEYLLRSRSKKSSAHLRLKNFINQKIHLSSGQNAATFEKRVSSSSTEQSKLFGMFFRKNPADKMNETELFDENGEKPKRSAGLSALFKKSPSSAGLDTFAARQHFAKMNGQTSTTLRSALKNRFLQRSNSAATVSSASSFSHNFTKLNGLAKQQQKPVEAADNLDVDLRTKASTKKSLLNQRKSLAVSTDDLTIRKSLSIKDLHNRENIKNNNTKLSISDFKLSKKFSKSATLTPTKKHIQANNTSTIAGVSMNSHATATQALNLQSSGQSSVVGHHRGFSQPSAAGNSAGDPWFLQSTGHQMPPTAPARHNKRPAPQPTVGGIGIGVVGAIGGGLLQQQQHSQSQPHIVPPTIPPHQNNVNPHINSIHLSSHALNSHNLITSNHPTKLPNQQLQSVQQHIIPPTHPTCQAQLLTNSSNNNLMTSSLNAAQLQGHLNSASGKMHAVGGLIMQQQPSQPPSLSLITTNQCPPSVHVPLTTNVMSTSLHNFDANGTAWNSTSSLSPTISNTSSTSSTNHQQHQMHQQSSMHPQHQQQHIQQQSQHPQRKCEVKLNAMPWFHGSISRDEAEHLLQPRDDGLFLVRESTNFPGDYTLCVCFQGKVEHYRVKYLENKLTIDDEEYFENLGQLVAHYEKDADGLCTQLIKCLPKMGKQEFCINSKDFADKGWVIPESDLQIRESIGKGEFGDVMLGILRGERVAVKMLKDDGAAQKFLAEASVMTTLEHENLVKFIGLVFTNKHIYLVTEYMSKGSLVDYLRSRGRQHITKKDQINFAYDTCSGMEYLEAKKVVHRDLAARNVLIAENCSAKVSDFGLAREECYNLEVGKLPIKWTAPEALKGGRFSNKSDMWSFGILLWEIYSFGRVPYPRIPLADVVKHVEVGYKMEAPEGCPPEIYEMMRQAWDLNPAKRPTFAELKVKLLQLKNATT